jgi:hypothetical protein
VWDRDEPLNPTVDLLLRFQSIGDAVRAFCRLLLNELSSRNLEISLRKPTASGPEGFSGKI